MAALIAQVNRALSRGHALFGEPVPVGRAQAGGAALRGAGNVVRNNQIRAAALSGHLASGYGEFAATAWPALDAAAGTDTSLLGAVDAAATANQAGHVASVAALTGAATDTATLEPASATPAGQRAIVTALRSRLAQQQRLIHAYGLRDARLAALLRFLAYGSEPARGGAPVGPDGFAPVGFGGGQGLPAMLVSALAPPGSPGLGGHTRGPVLGIPLGALTPDSSTRDVAAAIIHEAWRRGYSPQQTIAILSCAMQESGLHTTAVSPNGLWRSIFQQDASYAGRDNPNLAIAEFFNRLDRHGGPSSPDIWKSIFWLQQRPGDPSAQEAYAHGRRAYLTEITSQRTHAEQMYRRIAGGQ